LLSALEALIVQPAISESTLREIVPLARQLRDRRSVLSSHPSPPKPMSKPGPAALPLPVQLLAKRTEACQLERGPDGKLRWKSGVLGTAPAPPGQKPAPNTNHYCNSLATMRTVKL
jgi:hypothetical protein